MDTCELSVAFEMSKATSHFELDEIKGGYSI
jgi:hypothetical protein